MPSTPPTCPLNVLVGQTHVQTLESQQTTVKGLEPVPSTMSRSTEGSPDAGWRSTSPGRGGLPRWQCAVARRTSTLTGAGWPENTGKRWWADRAEQWNLKMKNVLPKEHYSEIQRKPDKWKIRQLLTPRKKAVQKKNCSLLSSSAQHSNDLNRLMEILDMDLTTTVSYLGNRMWESQNHLYHVWEAQR